MRWGWGLWGESIWCVVFLYDSRLYFSDSMFCSFFLSSLLLQLSLFRRQSSNQILYTGTTATRFSIYAIVASGAFEHIFLVDADFKIKVAKKGIIFIFKASAGLWNR